LVSLSFSFGCIVFDFLSWWSCLDTGANSTADGSLGDHLGWKMLLRIILYFEKLVSVIVNMFWNFSLALLCNLDVC